MKDNTANLLRRIVQRRDPAALHLVDLLGVVPLAEDDREHLRGLVAEELCDMGLDQLGGHSLYGVALEDVIDALGSA